MGRNKVLNALEATPRRDQELGPSDFATSASTPGDRSRFGRLRADTPVALKAGRANPLYLALPAYESVGPTDGTADNTETFALSHSVMQSPATEDIVVWLDGEYYGSPDAVDYDADTFDVTDAGTASTVHAYYISDAPATFEIEKVTPDGNVRAPIYDANLSLTHSTNQHKDPEYLSIGQNFGGSLLERFVATDMTLDLYVDAPYVVRFTDPDGDGTSPTNALLTFKAQQGEREVPGLDAAVRDSMQTGRT